MKKLVALLLAALMLASFAACTKEENNKDDLHEYLQVEEVVDHAVVGDDTFYLRPIDTETVAITGYKGSDALHAVTIPARMANRNVSVIDEFAFKDCTAITSITFPETVETIGHFAFAGCLALESVTIPATVTTIAEGAFVNCKSLLSVTFGENTKVESIEANAFSGCASLQSVVIPATVKTVGEGAFYGCTSLKSVTISEGVESLGAQAFQNCSSLSSLTLPASLTSFAVSQVDAGSVHMVFAGCTNLDADAVVAPEGSAAAAYFAAEHATGKTAGKCACEQKK